MRARGHQADHLAAPAELQRWAGEFKCGWGLCIAVWKMGRGVAYADDAPGLDGGVLGLEGLDKLGKLVGDAGGRVLAEEGAQVLLLLGRVGRVPGLPA